MRHKLKAKICTDLEVAQFHLLNASRQLKQIESATEERNYKTIDFQLMQIDRLINHYKKHKKDAE